MLRRGSAVVIVGLLVSQAGCRVVVYDNPPPRQVVVVREAPPPPPPATEIVITQNDEVHYVVYREYFGCAEAEIHVIPYYRRYYAATDDDIYFVMFVARRSGVPFDVCYRRYYYECGRSYDRLVVAYNVPRSHFFCSAAVGVSSYPTAYQRTYVAYHQNNLSSITIQNHEYIALVHMKVAVEYQGHPPATYFAHVHAAGGNTGHVIVQNRDTCGKGGVTVTGARVTPVAPRPWTMPPAQKQEWHEQHKAAVVKNETRFTEVHKDPVQRVQAQPPKPTPAPGAARGADKQDRSRATTPGAAAGPDKQDRRRPAASDPGSKSPQPAGSGERGRQPAKIKEPAKGKPAPSATRDHEKHKGEEEKKKSNKEKEKDKEK
jgi:hypothetical protein